MRTRAVGTVVLALTVACSAEAVSTRDVTGDTLVAQRVLTIGQAAGDENYLFGEIWSVAADSAGRIYVADGMASVVMVYDSLGGFRARIGRKGEGPGEFMNPSDLFFDGEGRLWVRDGNRATVFAPRRAGAIPDSVVETRPFLGYTNWTEKARSRLVSDVYYYPHYQFRRGEPERYFYLGYGPDGLTADTVEVPQYETLQGSRSAFFRVSEGSGRMVRGLNRAPFEPVATWTMTRAGNVLGGGGISTVVETDRRGDTLRLIEVRPRREVSSQERRDSAAAVAARIDSLPVPLNRVEGVSERIRDGVLPDTVPGYIAVHVSEQDSVWVRRWPPPAASGATFYDVYDSDGHYHYTAEIPAVLLDSPPPFILRDRIIGVVEDPDTGIHQVVVFGL